MRTLLGIYLLACLTLPFVGTYIWLQQERAEVKRFVHEKLEKGVEPKELVTLTFSNSELNRLRWEHEREFEYQGQMYDVVEKKIQGDSIVYLCWWDHEETRLKEEMRKILAGAENDLPQQNDQQKRLNSFEKNLYVAKSSFLEKNKMKELPKILFPPLLDGYVSPCLTPLTPPPDRS